MALSSRSKLLLMALGLLLAVGLLSVVAFFRPSEDPGTVIEVSGPMPRLQGEAVVGDQVTPDAYADRPVVVNFWASWCGPCRREQPGLQRLSEEYDGRVAFVGVDFMDDPAAAREYVREFGVTYPSVRDPDGGVGYDFAIPYLPATVLVDSDGELRYRLLGAQPEADLEGHLRELRADPA